MFGAVSNTYSELAYIGAIGLYWRMPNGIGQYVKGPCRPGPANVFSSHCLFVDYAWQELNAVGDCCIYAKTLYRRLDVSERENAVEGLHCLSRGPLTLNFEWLLQFFRSMHFHDQCAFRYQSLLCSPLSGGI